MIRKPASFMSSICDDRGQELLYAGMPITDVIKEDVGIGGVLSLLWFRKRYSIVYIHLNCILIFFLKNIENIKITKICLQIFRDVFDGNS